MQLTDEQRKKLNEVIETAVNEGMKTLMGALEQLKSPEPINPPIWEFKPIVLVGSEVNSGVTGTVLSMELTSERYHKLTNLPEHLNLVERAKQFMVNAWNNYGELPDWENEHQHKYCLCLLANSVSTEMLTKIFQFLHFPTEESRREFRSKFTDEDIKLIILGVW